jgi:hypothetical protein
MFASTIDWLMDGNCVHGYGVHICVQDGVFMSGRLRSESSRDRHGIRTDRCTIEHARHIDNDSIRPSFIAASRQDMPCLIMCPLLEYGLDGPLNMLTEQITFD